MAFLLSENTMQRLGPHQFLTVENYGFSVISFPMTALDIILAAKPTKFDPLNRSERLFKSPNKTL